MMQSKASAGMSSSRVMSPTIVTPGLTSVKLKTSERSTCFPNRFV